MSTQRMVVASSPRQCRDYVKVVGGTEDGKEQERQDAPCERGKPALVTHAMAPSIQPFWLPFACAQVNA